MKCAIVQPSYVPWIGYFQLIASVDVFVFLDDVQFDLRGWRNRNQIRTRDGLKWITIPVLGRGVRSSRRAIANVRIDWSRNWARKHWESLRHAYGKTPHFGCVEAWLRPFYDRRDYLIADFTVDTTLAMARAFGLRSTQFLRSSQLGVPGVRSERLVNILELLGATDYLSGPAGHAYLDVELFTRRGKRIEYIQYARELPWPYAGDARNPHVSALDVLYNIGYWPGFQRPVKSIAL